MDNKNSQGYLGVFAVDKYVYLYHFLENVNSFRADESSDGFTFHKTSADIHITKTNDRLENIHKSRFFRISLVEKPFYLTYLNQNIKKEQLCIARCDNLKTWTKVGQVSRISEGGVLLPYKQNNFYLLVFGGKSIKIATTLDFSKWRINKNPLIKAHSPNNFFEIGTAIEMEDKIGVVYFEKVELGNSYHYLIKLLHIDKKYSLSTSPTSGNIKLIWRMPEEFLKENLTPIGIVQFNRVLISYWLNKKGSIYAIPHKTITRGEKPRSFPQLFLNRLSHNPILKPLSKRFWESRAVFNPAALYEDGKVHIIYRAIGDGDTSVMGYATSSDGVKIDYRSPYPVYVPTQPFELPQTAYPFPQSPFASGGGGHGGCEDPRIVKIGNRIYMTYVAHDGRNPPRIALTSIDIEDFRNQRWNWETPVLISPPGIVNKNACLLPEKVAGKYVMFHRVFPNILLDFLDDLDFDGKSKWLKGDYQIKPRKYSWDSRKLGVGAPPIKTRDGWLTIYQAVGDQDPGRYKMGAMLLDLCDPTKVLYRNEEPILSPDMNYENEGHKAGVVYPCGAVNLNDDLIVYYGGADTVVCAARANLNTFLENLKEGTKLTLEQVKRTAVVAAYN